MYRTTDLLFMFLFQYFFLGISSNLFSLSGAIFIACGMLMVIAYKLLDKNEKDKQMKLLEKREANNKQLTEEGKSLIEFEIHNSDNPSRNSNCLKRVLFYKF